MREKDFDPAQAKEIAQALSQVAGLGCLVCAADGENLAEYGNSCKSCGFCAAVRRSKAGCTQAHDYGMAQAERFGGKYVYYCPLGLTCFVALILGEIKPVARITAGPFLMVDKEDFMDCELRGLSEEIRADALIELEKIPVVPAAMVNHLETLLAMAVGFINNAAVASRHRRNETATTVQGQITEYMMTLKQKSPCAYPIEKEHALLRFIRKGEKNEANRLLNELLGHILFNAGYECSCAKSRIYELLVLIGRAAIDSGADAKHILAVGDDCLRRLPAMQSTEEISLWLCDKAGEFMDAIFAFADVRHANAIHRCVQYIETHYGNKVALEQLAEAVNLSPSYLSRIFKQETGTPFHIYLNQVRVDKSKELLLQRGLRLIDIAVAVGFEDQSYFTKVFKRYVGVTPNQYRILMRKEFTLRGE